MRATNVLILFFAAACGSGSEAPSLQIVTYSSDFEVARITPAQNRNSVSSLFLNLDNLSAKECGGDSVVITDALTGVEVAPTAKIALVETPTVCEMTLALSLASFPLDPGAPPFIASNSLFFEGITEFVRPFRVSLPTDAVTRTVEEIDFSSDDIFIGIDVAALFANVAWNAATLDQDNIFTVNATENADLQSTFETNAASSVKIFKDDGDGTFSIASDTPISQ